MNAEFANIFVQSAIDVFEKEVNVKLTRKKLAITNTSAPNNPIAIIIGITGSLGGQIVFAMDQSFAHNIAQSMMPNKLPDDAKKFTNSAISEIANMITGRASITLAGESDHIYLTPPAVITASDISVDFLKIPTIALTLICNIGVLEINIAVAKIKKGGK